VTPFGLGGLTLGVAGAVKAIRPDVRLFTVEPDTAAPLAASLAAGRPTAVDRQASFVDAIGTPQVLDPMFDALKDVLSGALTVSLAEAEAAVADLFRIQKMIVEGAAACGLAAGRRLVREGGYRRVAVVMTGAEEAIRGDILRRTSGH